MKTLIAIVVLSVFIVPSNSLIKEWIPNINFENPNNWVDNKLPCPSDSITFPEELITLISLPQTLSTKQIILPQNGGIMLPFNSEITIGENKIQKSGCKSNSNEKALFKAPELKPWLLSENWKTLTDLNEVITNEAIPHLERIPCPNDIIRFKENTNIIVDLQDVNYVSQGKKQLLGNTEFPNRVNQQVKNMMFLNTVDMMENVCPKDFDDCTCMSSGIGRETILESLCENEREFCKVPHCLNPIQPYGHCCKICGSTVVITLKSDKKQAITAKLNSKMKNLYEKKYFGKIDGHVAIFSNDDDYFVQIIVVDKGDYSGISGDFIDEFRAKNLDSVYQSKYLLVRKSGRPFDPNGGISVWVIFFGPLFIIAGFFLVLHVHYIQGKKIFTVPDWASNRFHLPANMLSNPFIFARFDNTRRDSEYENVTVGLDCALEKEEAGTASGFNNPLFNKEKQEKIESGELDHFKEIKFSEVLEKDGDFIDNIQ